MFLVRKSLKHKPAKKEKTINTKVSDAERMTEVFSTVCEKKKRHYKRRPMQYRIGCLLCLENDYCFAPQEGQNALAKGSCFPQAWQKPVADVPEASSSLTASSIMAITLSSNCDC